MEAKRAQGPFGPAPSGSDRSRRALSYVGGLAVCFSAVVLFLIVWPLRWRMVAFWVAVEAIFYVFYYRPRYAELSAQPRPSHRPATEDAWAAFYRVLRYFKETHGTIDYEMYYSGWFMGAKFEDIKRGNAEEFLAYAFWYRTMQEMEDEGLGDVPGTMLRQLEAVWGLLLEPGYTPGLQFMGHLWEPVKAHWRPLAFYLGTWSCGMCAAHMLRRWGFQQASHQGMHYFTLNMEVARAPLRQPYGLPPISSDSSEDASAVSTDTSPAKPAAAASSAQAASSCGWSLPPAATDRPASAPDLPTAAAAGGSPGHGAERSSSPELPPLRTKSSPFQSPQGLSWAAKLAADAENLAASINVASALHDATLPAVVDAQQGQQAHPQQQTQQQAQHQAPLQQLAPVMRRSGSSAKRRTFGTSAPGTPRLTTHTSMALRALPNPLEQVLSEELANPDMPVLFLHGVGGLPAYLEMLLQVMALGHPLIVTQCTGVAMRLGPVLSADEVVAQVIGVLDKLGVEQACVIGHSYGTFIAGRLARLHRKRVRSLCLIDPVCFGMFMPQLLNNFLYTAPKWKGLHHIVDYIKKGGVYMASHELHVCTTFSRRFFWSDMNLWPEDLAPGSVVLLSGRDDLMDAQQVKAMLEEPGHIKVHYNRDLTHGEFLFKFEVKQAIMEEMRAMLARSGSAVVGLARPVLATTMTLACSALGVGGVVRLQTAGGGAKYVEDHTNQLVRTFTGNLTAMLQQVQSMRAFDSTVFTVHTSSNSSSSGGGSSRSRLSRAGTSAAAGGAPTSSGGSVPAVTSVDALMLAGGFLSGAMSVPLRRKLTKGPFSSQAIREQPSAGNSSGVESSGSNDAEQLDLKALLQAAAASRGEAAADPQAAAAEAASVGSRKDSLGMRAAARRSSGSGRVEAANSSKPGAGCAAG